MFDTLFYNPIYNAVVFLLNYIPDAGIVIIIITLIIKFLLFPFYNKQIETQIATKKAKPELDALKKRYGKKLTPEQKKKMMFETMDIYKKYNIRPFFTIIILIIQIPILFALFFIFYSGGLPEIDMEHLYSFVDIPKNISMSFLGVIDLTTTSIFLAGLAALAQFAQSSISMKDVKFSDLKGTLKNNNGDKSKLMEDMGKSFMVNIKYGMPIFIFILLATVLNAAVAIYWTTSNIFQLIQEILVRKKKKEL